MDMSQIWDQFFLKDNYYLALPFQNGTAYFRIKRHEDVIINPGAVAGQLGYIADVTPGNISDQYENTKPTLKYMLEPKDTNLLYHIIWGGSPSCGQFYMYYPANQSLGDLRDVRSESNEEFGFIYGRDSPYHNPNPQLTEFFTAKDIHPAWKVRIPSSCSAATYPCLMRFYVRKYYVDTLTNTADNPVDTKVMSIASRRSAELLKVPAPSWLAGNVA
jgi:hypothetical protein